MQKRHREQKNQIEPKQFSATIPEKMHDGSVLNPICASQPEADASTGPSA
jgi:hypothetical protein